MKRKKSVNDQLEHKVELQGYNFKLRVRDRDLLDRSALWISSRIEELKKKHPTLQPKEIYLLLLLELTYEREEIQSSGKALLNETNQLLEWIEHQI